MGVYDVIWDWKKELNETTTMRVEGKYFSIHITNEDHISCIDDIFFVIKKNCEYATPISKVEVVRLIKE